MRSVRTAVCAAVLSLLTSAVAHAAITGSVVDENGAPVASAEIRLFTPESSTAFAARIAAGKPEREPVARVRTAENGTFSVSAPTGLAFDLAATASGHEAFVQQVVDGDALGTLPMRTAKPLRGRVTAGGKPVAGAFVLGPGLTMARSATDGTFEVPPSSTPAMVQVFHPDYSPASEAMRQGVVTEVKLTQGITLRGRVLGTDGRTPVAQATVQSGFASTETAADGSFVIAHLPRQWRTLTASSAAGTALAYNDGKSVSELRLRPAASVTGSVRDVKSRSGVAGARVMIASSLAVTDSRGNFTLSGVPPGEQFIVGSHPAYQISPLTITLAPGARDNRTLGAMPLAKISGVVMDEERKPVAAAIVSRTGRGRTAFTGPKGEFVIRTDSMRAFMQPNVQLRITKKGYASTTREVSVEPGETLGGVTITLPRGFPLTVTVRDRDNQPVAGAELRLSAARDGMREGMATAEECDLAGCVTDSRGALALQIVPGKYDVRVTGDQIVTTTMQGESLEPKKSPLAITVDAGVEVSGRVVRADGTPIPDATVFVRDSMARATTDASGAFSMHNARRGSATLMTTLPEPLRTMLPAKEITAPATGVVITAPRTGGISGRVFEAESRQPVTDFRISFLRQMVSGMQQFHAEDGSFTVNELPPGRFDINVTASGYVAGTAAGVIVEEGKTTPEVEVRLARGGVVKGHVTAEGQPVSGVTAYVSDESTRGSSGTPRATTDANGDYEMTGVPAGERTITFTQQGYVRVDKKVEAAPGKDARLDATLERGNSVRGRVVDETGAAVAGADVRAEGGDFGPPVRSDSDGKFELAGLRENRVRIVAQKQGYVQARVDDVDATSPASISLTLRRGGTITGRVSGLSEDELRRVMVSARTGTFARGTVDSTGAFTISGIPDGKVMIEAGVMSSTGARSARKQVDVVNGSAAPVELVFGTGYTVTGRVTKNGSPFEDLGAVSFSAMRGASGGGSAQITSGKYSIEGLEAGEYNVGVFGPGTGNLYSGRITVSGNSTYDIDITGQVLRGVVTDANTGAPIPGATVQVSPPAPRTQGGGPVYQVRPAVTDSVGHFMFDSVSDGQWKVTVQKQEYQTAMQTVTVAAGAPDVQVQLSPATAAIVHLVDAQTNAPVAGSVTASQGKAAPSTNASARGDGIAQLWLAPGHYDLRAFARDYTPATASLDVPGAEVTIRMERAARIVLLMRGQPAMVRARLMRGTPPKPYMGTNNGRFENVTPGQYTIELLGPDNKPTASRPVSVVSGQTATVNFD